MIYKLSRLQVLEIEALQSSSNKLNEDRIFDLKQRIEDLMMERDTLNAQNKQQKKELSSLRYTKLVPIITLCSVVIRLKGVCTLHFPQIV